MEEIIRLIILLTSADFLHFCREYLHIPSEILEKAKKYAEIPRELKFQQVQEAYQKGPRIFVEKFGPYLHNLLRNVHPNTEYPEELPSGDAYRVINSQKGIDWMTFVRETLQLKVDKDEIRYCNKNLSEEQKHTLLQGWIDENRMTRTYVDLEELFLLHQRDEHAN